MDRRTLRAALLADVIAFVAVAGLGVFLGFDAVASVIAGAVAGTFAFGVLFAASARAESFTGPEHVVGVDDPAPRNEPLAPQPGEHPPPPADAPGGPAGEPQRTDDPEESR